MVVTIGDLVRTRFPRLLVALQQGAELSEHAALEVLVEYHVFGVVNEPATPAVMRLGGQLAAIRHAIRHRGATHAAVSTESVHEP